MPAYSPETALASRADLDACSAAIRQGSRSFFVASLLLPERVRTPAFGLYAFCRLSDDEVDETSGGVAAVERLRERLDRAYDGAPFDDAADRMLADLVARYAIPKATPEALIEGLSWDVEGRRYHDRSELRSYCARVAGTVGVMMTLIMGVRSPEALARACDLGVAMQLTNIVRDVGEDARHGRLYLPMNDMRNAGLDPDAWLCNPVLDDRLRSVLADLLDEAEMLYRRAAQGTSFLPLDCRPAIHAARLIYSDIGRSAERAGLDVLTQRARVSGARKLALLCTALASTAVPSPGPAHSSARHARPLPEVLFLVEAVTQLEVGRPTIKDDEHRWWHMSTRFGRVLDIFERLQQREEFGS
jgi:phytoene synthase